MKGRVSNWFSFGLAVVGSIAATLVVAGLLNFTGDCAPEVTNCGEKQRQASFVVLGLGIVWIAYLIVRFIRSDRTFR